MTAMAADGTLIQEIYLRQIVRINSLLSAAKSADRVTTGRISAAENPLGDGRFLDACIDPERPAAAPAGLDVHGKDPLETLRPRQRPLPGAGRGLTVRLALAGGRGPTPRHHPRPIRARRRRDAHSALWLGA